MFRLRYERLSRRWTARKVAKDARINRSYYSQIELGRMVPRPDELARLSKVFGIPAEHLMDDVEASHV